MKFLKWLGNVCRWILRGQRGQTSPPAPVELTPAQKRRQAQLDWQAQFQALVTAGRVQHVTLPVTTDSPYLPAGLTLTANGLIDPRCIASCAEHKGSDNSLFPAFAGQLLAEALQTNQGQFVVAKHAAAEVCAQQLGLTLNDPAVLGKAPAYLRPYVRHIDIKKDN